MRAGMQHMHTHTYTHVTKHYTTKAYKVENEHFHHSQSHVLWLEEVLPTSLQDHTDIALGLTA